MKTIHILLFVIITSTLCRAQEKPPGVIVDYLPKTSEKYIGSPSICILPNGDYVASHDEFGPKSSEFRSAVTRIFHSSDKGVSWKEISMIQGLFWSNLFLHNGTLYNIGTNKHHGNLVIRKSTDGGKTWTNPYSGETGLILEGEYHTAPMPMVIHSGRIWRAIEYATAPSINWGERYSAMMISAPVNSDLLNAKNWTKTDHLPYNHAYLDGKFGAWLEGNAVVGPDGQMLDILRVQVPAGTDEYAAIVEISKNGKKASFDPATGFIKFPGGAKKFTIRYDNQSKRYWTIHNIVAPQFRNIAPGSVRNIQALSSSKDLKTWQVHEILLQHPEVKLHGFQYVDWQFEGDDIIFLSRTAFDDELGGARNNHDANYLTFHRIPGFRMLSAKSVDIEAIKLTIPDDYSIVKFNHPGLVVDLEVGLWPIPIPVDYDNDGLMDLLVSCTSVPNKGLYFYKNIGTQAAPLFDAPKLVDKGLTNVKASYVGNEIRVMKSGGEFAGFKTNLFSKPVDIPVDVQPNAGLKPRTNYWSYVDYDGDGDLDIIVGVDDWTDYGWDNAFDEKGKWKNGPLHGYVFLLENQNGKYVNKGKIMASGKPIDTYGAPCPNMYDFDGDGDLDIICGEFVDKLTWFENIGTRKNPEFAEGRFLQDENGDTIKFYLEMITPVAVDFNGDGHVDLLVGEEDGRVAYLESTGKKRDRMPLFKSPVFLKQKADNLKFGGLVTPFSVDWDGDGNEDLICGNTAGNIAFIKNLGGNPPKWAAPVLLKSGGKDIHIQAGYNGSIQGPCEAKWGYTTLTVADWDHDGKKDIIINSIWGEVLWYRNTGDLLQLEGPHKMVVSWENSPLKPAWNWWNPGKTDLVTQWRTTPVAIDWNKDGLTDLVMLDHEGYLAFFERYRDGAELKLKPGKRIFYDAGESLDTPAVLRLNDKDAGRSGRRKLCFVDWDKDGDLDLIVNSENAAWYENIKQTDNAVYLKFRGNLGEKRLAGHTTSPTTVDWNQDGLPELLVGAEDGHFYLLKNPKSTDSK